MMQTKRRRGAIDLASAICHGCGDPIAMGLHVRSRRWAYGIVGCHFAYCSRECRDADERAQEERSG